MRIQSVRVVPSWEDHFLCRVVVARALEDESRAVGVGTQDPHAVPAMPGSNLARAEHTPLRIEPEVGQSLEDTVEASRSEELGVFHEDECGSNFADHAEHLEPEARARPFEAGAFAGG